MDVVTNAFVNEAEWAGMCLGICFLATLIGAIVLSVNSDTDNPIVNFFGFAAIFGFLGMFVFGGISAYHSTIDESGLERDISMSGYLGVDAGIEGDWKRFTAVVDGKEQQCAMFETDIETVFKVECVDQ